MKNKSIGVLIGLLTGMLAFVALILYIVNGASDAGVVFGLLITIAAYGLYGFISNEYLDILPTIATICITLALGKFLVDSIANFMDYFNGITMFQSGGSIELIFTIIGFLTVSLVLSLITGFMRRTKKVNI